MQPCARNITDDFCLWSFITNLRTISVLSSWGHRHSETEAPQCTRVQERAKVKVWPHGPLANRFPALWQSSPASHAIQVQVHMWKGPCLTFPTTVTVGKVPTPIPTQRKQLRAWLHIVWHKRKKRYWDHVTPGESDREAALRWSSVTWTSRNCAA